MAWVQKGQTIIKHPQMVKHRALSGFQLAVKSVKKTQILKNGLSYIWSWSIVDLDLNFQLWCLMAEEIVNKHILEFVYEKKTQKMP